MSIVMRIRDLRTGRFFAGKRGRKGSEVHRSGDYMNEVKMLLTLSQLRHVVDLHGVFDGPTDFWMVLEMCDGGRLEEWLARYPTSARAVASQLVEAVTSMHDLCVCHLDLKPDNVLLTEAGDVRLCDFVTSCQLSCPEQQLVGKCGTDGFRAPEVATGEPYSGLLADVFSLGRTLQTVALADLAWRELSKSCRQMTAEAPRQRPRAHVVRETLFGGGPSCERELVLDFSSLESTSCRDAAAGSTEGGHVGRIVSCGLSPRAVASAAAVRAPVPSHGVEAPARARTEAAEAHRPPPLRSRRVEAVAPGPTAAAFARTAPTNSGSTRRAAARGPAALAGARRMACGSAFCQRLGACLCQDQPSQAVAKMTPTERHKAKVLKHGGQRRSNTP